MLLKALLTKKEILRSRVFFRRLCLGFRCFLPLPGFLITKKRETLISQAFSLS
jgi:hypothetical protein